jgi:hypothetical protein
MHRRRIATLMLTLMSLAGAIFPLATARAAASASTTHFSVPISDVITCSERVRVTGQFDFTSQTTESNAEATLVVLHLRADDIVGIGLKSGASYRLVGAASEITVEGIPVFTATFVHHGVLVGGEPGAEHSLSITFHTTVNKKNEVLVGIDKSECD